MSVAACGGGMGGSDDDEKDQITRKRLAEVDLGFVVSSNEDEDDDKKEEDEITKTKLYRRRIVLRRIMSIRRKLSMHYPGKSRSFQNLKEIGITDAKELRKIEHPFNMKRRRLETYVESPLSKMTRAKNEGQDDVVKDDDEVEKKNKGNDSNNQEDGK